MVNAKLISCGEPKCCERHGVIFITVLVASLIVLGVFTVCLLKTNSELDRLLADHENRIMKLESDLELKDAICTFRLYWTRNLPAIRKHGKYTKFRVEEISPNMTHSGLARDLHSRFSAEKLLRQIRSSSEKAKSSPYSEKEHLRPSGPGHNPPEQGPCSRTSSETPAAPTQGCTQQVTWVCPRN